MLISNPRIQTFADYRKLFHHDDHSWDLTIREGERERVGKKEDSHMLYRRYTALPKTL